jgi:probable biosynthetic protein (TIGR04098 family)
MTFDYDLLLGMQHTNLHGLAEHLLLAQAGHLHWSSLSKAIGVPLSTLRTLQGGEVYATFFFIDLQFPRDRPITAFDVDDRLTFLVSLRAFKNIAVEATMTFDRADCVREAGSHPAIRLASIFITPEQGNGALRVAPPTTGDFSKLPLLPNDENPYQLTKAADATGELGIIGDGWAPLTTAAEVEHEIDPERDTNGAGLVYFANYAAFMNAAERHAWIAASTAASDSTVAARALAGRALVSRRIAYYGNVEVDGAVRTEVSLFHREDDPALVGVRYTVRRRGDNHVICRSEAVKTIGAAHA